MRKRVLFGSVYVPLQNAERTGDDGDDDSDETDSEDGDNESNDKDELRQELLHEFSEVKDSDAEEIEQLFGDVIDEVRDEEDKRKLPGNKEDKDRFMLFESRITRLLKSQKTVTMVRSLCQRRRRHTW